MLARRPHFRAELAAKLAQRGYESEEIETTLDRLAAKGFLDDAEAARQFTAGRLARGPLGRRRLAAELGRRGAPREAAQSALDELTDEDDRESAREAARRWLRGRRADRAALARHLERRGFSPRAIVGALEELPDEPEAT
jgi:regulatory protein